MSEEAFKQLLEELLRMDRGITLYDLGFTDAIRDFAEWLEAEGITEVEKALIWLEAAMKHEGWVLRDAQNDPHERRDIETPHGRLDGFETLWKRLRLA